MWNLVKWYGDAGIETDEWTRWGQGQDVRVGWTGRLGSAYIHYYM